MDLKISKCLRTSFEDQMVKSEEDKDLQEVDISVSQKSIKERKKGGLKPMDERVFSQKKIALSDRKELKSAKSLQNKDYKSTKSIHFKEDN